MASPGQAQQTVLANTDDPSQGSFEYRAMKDTWDFIADILAGASAMRQNPRYLMKYEGESVLEYERRLAAAPWRPEFEDCLRGLTSRPFTKDVGLKNPAPSLATLSEDIDGRGNNMTTFAREVFFKGMAKGVHAIVVDYPAMHPVVEGRAITLAEEKAAGVRPYWIHAEANDILALYTTWVNGKEIVTHLRIRENFTTRQGFGETTGTRIRIYEPGHWEVWEKVGNADKYSKTSEGVISRGPQKFDSVPVVFFFTGDRQGDLRLKPPLKDLAEMQLELFRAQSRQDEMLTYASSPMLTANGMRQPEENTGPLQVGPKAVLWAPAVGASWNYINPDSSNLKEVREHVASVIDDMKRLGMQPLVARTGRQTATGDSIEAAKAHSSVQAWAIGLKDALEQAWVFTAQWINETRYPEVTVYTDFSAVPASKAPLDSLATARAEGDISRETFWEGLQRYDILPPDFDAKQEKTRLEAEAKEPKPVPPPLVKRDPVTGEAIPGTIVVPPPAPVQAPAN